MLLILHMFWNWLFYSGGNHLILTIIKEKSTDFTPQKFYFVAGVAAGGGGDYAIEHTIVRSSVPSAGHLAVE